MTKAGRNDPCPCGSGQKYKKCCMHKAVPVQRENGGAVDSGAPNPAAEVLSGVRDMLGNADFASEDALKDAVDRFMLQKNTEAKADFLGLSAEQMHEFRRLGNDRFGRYVHLNFEKGRPEYIEAPMVVTAFALMLHIARAERVPATDDGYLPVELVREIQTTVIDGLFGEQPSVESELDAPDLLRIRCALELAELLEVRDGEFRLTKKGMDCLQPAVQQEDASLLYEQLLLVFLNEMNWHFLTVFLDTAGEVQRNGLFNLYMLREKAGSWVRASVLAEHFLAAFPLVPIRYNAEIRESGYTKRDGKEELRFAFGQLFLEMFCRGFNLIDVRIVPSGRRDLESLEVTTTALFDTTFRWTL